MSNLIRRPFLSDELSCAEISRCGKLFSGVAPFSARNVIIIIMKFHLDRVDSIKQCRSYGLSLWQCPQFLFLIMGAITIISIIATYFASRYYIQEPEVVALIVLAVAAIIFIIGHIIVSSFDMIASASRAKSEFVSIMSHQLRTPLSIIKWQLNLIYEKHIGTENSEIKKFLDHLGEENQRMLHIINDLLELNRIEDRNLYLNPSNFSLGEVVGDLIDRRNKSLLEAESNVFIETKIPENLPDVFADKIKAESVASHIVDNAIRYSANGGKIEATLVSSGKYIKCSVTDQGIGISEKDQKMIFSKFFRAGNVFRYQTQGLGIRLYLAKAIVEAMGGKIGFRSEEGKGSVFWFTLPAAKV